MSLDRQDTHSASTSTTIDGRWVRELKCVERIIIGHGIGRWRRIRWLMVDITRPRIFLDRESHSSNLLTFWTLELTVTGATGWFAQPVPWLTSGVGPRKMLLLHLCLTVIVSLTSRRLKRIGRRCLIKQIIRRWYTRWIVQLLGCLAEGIGVHTERMALFKLLRDSHQSSFFDTGNEPNRI